MTALADRFWRLTSADLERVRALELASGRRPWSTAAVRDELANAQARCYGITAPADEAGCLQGWMALREQAQEWWLFQIVVHPAQRRHGLARALLSWALEDRTQSAYPFLLEVRASNQAALALYRSLGFLEIATRPRYYPGLERDGKRENAILMRARH